MFLDVLFCCKWLNLCYLILGRTIREFITYTLTLPIIYIFLWFSIFGGVGLKMEREAELNNITCASVFGGKNATEGGINGLFRLSCRYRKNQNKTSF